MSETHIITDDPVYTSVYICLTCGHTFTGAFINETPAQYLECDCGAVAENLFPAKKRVKN
jgi:hypothetical protein